MKPGFDYRFPVPPEVAYAACGLDKRVVREPQAHAEPARHRFPVPAGSARARALGAPLPAARPARRRRSHPVLAQPDRLPAHRRRVRGHHRRGHRPALRRPLPGPPRGHRPGPGHRGRGRAVRRGVRLLLHPPRRGRRDRPLRAVRPVRTRRYLPDLRPRTAPPRQGVPVLRDQAGPGGDHRTAAGGRRPARLLRQVGHLARRPRRAGHRSGWPPGIPTWSGSVPRAWPGPG